MCPLAISHSVDVQVSIPRDRWQHRVIFSVELSWGQIVSGEGYDGLEQAFVNLRKRLTLQKPRRNERTRRDPVSSKAAEIDFILGSYLSQIRRFASEYEAKAGLVMAKVLDEVEGTRQADRGIALEPVEIDIHFLLRKRQHS